MAHLGPVELLTRQYLQLLDPEQLTLPTMESLRLLDTQAKMFDSMFREAVITHLPPLRYRLRVLKKLMNALEKAMEDPEEDVCLVHLPNSFS